MEKSIQMKNKLEELQIKLNNIEDQEKDLQVQGMVLRKEKVQLIKQISSVKFGFAPTLERICEICNNKDTLYLQRKEYLMLVDYIKNNHPYIRLESRHEMGSRNNLSNIELCFLITWDSLSNQHVNKIEYLFSLLKPNEEERKIIYFENDGNEIWELFTKYDVIGIRKYTEYSTYTVFENMQEALDYLYKDGF
jgi:hypothetical protein